MSQLCEGSGGKKVRRKEKREKRKKGEKNGRRSENIHFTQGGLKYIFDKMPYKIKSGKNNMALDSTRTSQPPSSIAADGIGCMTGQNRTEQNRTEQNRTEQNRAEQNRTGQNKIGQLSLEKANEHMSTLIHIII